MDIKVNQVQQAPQASQPTQQQETDGTFKFTLVSRIEEQDLQNALGQYVYVKLREPKQGLADVRGDLAALEPESVTVHYKDKGRPKKLVVDRDNISLIMTAVKI